MGSLYGCCGWCLLLLAGWCEGFYSVREWWRHDAVFVPFLLNEKGNCRHGTHLFGCMSLGFIARRNGLAAPSARLSRASACIIGRHRLIHVCWVSNFGRNCRVGVTIMIASGLINFRCCCALRLDGNSQVGIILICVFLEKRVVPWCNIAAQLPTSACASRQVPCVPCWIAFIIICPFALCLLSNHNYIYNEPDSMWWVLFNLWHIDGPSYVCTERHAFDCISNQCGSNILSVDFALHLCFILSFPLLSFPSPVYREGKHGFHANSLKIPSNHSHALSCRCLSCQYFWSSLVKISLDYKGLQPGMVAKPIGPNK